MNATSPSIVRPALVLFVALSAVTGLLYPLAVTGMAQALWPRQANGSLVEHRGRVVGSSLVGQHFASAGYFHGRPSATGGQPYDARASSGSNLGPDNPALLQAVRERIAALGVDGGVPVDLVTASASGLDPDVSPAAARLQAPAVAAARGLPLAQVVAAIEAEKERRTLGLWGEPRVNVLRLNLRLDALADPGAEAYPR